MSNTKGNPVAAFIGDTESTLAKVRNSVKKERDNPHPWLYLKLSAMDDPTEAGARAYLVGNSPRAADGAFREGPDGMAAIWLHDGDPDHEPEWLPPIGEGGPKEWAIAPRAALPRSQDPQDALLELYEQPPGTPVRIGEVWVAIWLHLEAPTSEPEWPVTVEQEKAP